MRDNSRRLLNIGGGHKGIALPVTYQAWQVDLLDIQAHPDVDLLMDARALQTLNPFQYDAVYCAHNLEHYYPHEVTQVLAGICHVLKPAGFIEVVVPDLDAVFKAMLERKLQLESTLYLSPSGPITVHDVLYGYEPEIKSSGTPFYAHKTGFDLPRLERFLRDADFTETLIQQKKERFELHALAFLRAPSPRQLRCLGLS